MKREKITYRGITFVRYPDNKDFSARSYFRPTRKLLVQQGVQCLHQEIWKDLHGPIPEDHEIHHTDGNTLNNDPSNLECLHYSAHKTRHVEMRRQNPAECICRVCGKTFLAQTKHSMLCSQLCVSRSKPKRHGPDKRRMEERTCITCGKPFQAAIGRATTACSHSCAAKANFARRVPTDFVCGHCGATFQSTCAKPGVAFCSTKCRDAQYAATGRFQEQRSCVHCGTAFTVARSSPIKACSVACAQGNRWKRA